MAAWSCGIGCRLGGSGRGLVGGDRGKAEEGIAGAGRSQAAQPRATGVAALLRGSWRQTDGEQLYVMFAGVFWSRPLKSDNGISVFHD